MNSLPLVLRDDKRRAVERFATHAEAEQAASWRCRGRHASDPLDPRLLELLPSRPKAWRKFVEPIPAELVEFWIAKEPRYCQLAEFACTSGQWRCLWRSGDIEAYAQQGIRTVWCFWSRARSKRSARLIRSSISA
ncbi:hypothetical protein [Asaia prunellae]|uniref:hypothetical protein n=1 Tax=Asaia prunellae TaxID=610245 RepID=UPI0004729AF2|nr:hypothetical protein [Asaia prunellae]